MYLYTELPGPMYSDDTVIVTGDEIHPAKGPTPPFSPGGIYLTGVHSYCIGSESGIVFL